MWKTILEIYSTLFISHCAYHKHKRNTLCSKGTISSSTSVKQATTSDSVMCLITLMLACEHDGIVEESLHGRLAGEVCSYDAAILS